MSSLKLSTWAKKGQPLPRALALEVLALQQSFIADRNQADPDAGFLISSFSVEELSSLVDHDGALYLAREGETLVGYLLLTKITEFTHLLKPEAVVPEDGSFAQKRALDYARYDYLYQIAVLNSHRKHGAAKQLLDLACQGRRKGLLTDVLVEPVCNQASLKFFEKHGFLDVGNLYLSGYRTFGALNSKVLIWERDASQEQS